ncbi:Crp/Fnr family transcriptional regulator [Sphingobacterium anhuiense]|uniref:Crp/Fnr family transcriptional regulator n=1 Tax=Sphingobacterium anhuiense TaxID=493780 RepID=A0ABW5YXZ1_9SPHI
MATVNYQNLLFETLQNLAPVPPDLWADILKVTEIKPYKKGRHLYAQFLDLHIILEGIIIKRWDDGGAIPNDVIDFISKKQFIIHTEDVDGSYFKADCDAVTAFISRKNIGKLLEQHPIFANHFNYLIAAVLNRRSFRGKLLNMPAKERKVAFAKEYPEANFHCSISDKSSFLGINPSYYSTL